MGNPLQEQLLKAGLASKKQAKKAEHEKRISRKQNKGNPVVMSNTVREEQAVQAQRNRELNLQRAQKQRLREQKAQVKQIIEANRLARDERGEPYNFVEQNKIKRIFVSKEMTDQLSRGQLAIVKFGDGYEVVVAKVARQIISRDQDTVIVFHEKGEEVADDIVGK